MYDIFQTERSKTKHCKALSVRPCTPSHGTQSQHIQIHSNTQRKAQRPECVHVCASAACDEGAAQTGDDRRAHRQRADAADGGSVGAVVG